MTDEDTPIKLTLDRNSAWAIVYELRDYEDGTVLAHTDRQKRHNAQLAVVAKRLRRQLTGTLVEETEKAIEEYPQEDLGGPGL